MPCRSATSPSAGPRDPRRDGHLASRQLCGRGETLLVANLLRRKTKRRHFVVGLSFAHNCGNFRPICVGKHQLRASQVRAGFSAHGVAPVTERTILLEQGIACGDSGGFIHVRRGGRLRRLPNTLCDEDGGQKRCRHNDWGRLKNPVQIIDLHFAFPESHRMTRQRDRLPLPCRLIVVVARGSVFPISGILYSPHPKGWLGRAGSARFFLLKFVTGRPYGRLRGMYFVRKS